MGENEPSDQILDRLNYNHALTANITFFSGITFTHGFTPMHPAVGNPGTYADLRTEPTAAP